MVKKAWGAGIEIRILWVLGFFIIAMAALGGRLFLLQIVFHKDYIALAAKQHSRIKDALPERGSIFARDKNGELIPLALNRIQKTLVASPDNIKDPEAAAEILGQELGLEKSELLPKLTKRTDTYEIIKKKLESAEADKLLSGLPEGFFLEEEKRRIYPHDNLAAQILGFVSIDKDEEIGRYGIERLYEKDLTGSRGMLEGTKDPAGFWVSLGRKIIQPPENGSDIILTIDYNIQLKAEEVLKSLASKWGAPSGEIIVLEPKTGRILAEAVFPSYNPNEFNKEKDLSIFLNPSHEASYELGSVLKPIIMAAGLQEKAVTPQTTYEDKGEFKIGGFTIKNFDLKTHGIQTMTQVLEKSLNTGAIYVAKLIGKEKQLDYFKKFGFGEKTGVDLPGEVSGNISNLSAGRDIDFATASFGQGIAITPLQLAMALGAIANEGKLMKPYIVEQIKDDSGNIIEKSSETKRQVISKETAETLSKMLVSAVRNGFENRAGVPGYFIAGKTGTAQIPKKEERGYSEKVIHTFVGYGPAFDARFLILIQLNNPQGNRFASNTLTLGFHDLAQFILNYYEVPPDER